MDRKLARIREWCLKNSITVNDSDAMFKKMIYEFVQQLREGNDVVCFIDNTPVRISLCGVGGAGIEFKSL